MRAPSPSRSMVGVWIRTCGKTPGTATTAIKHDQVGGSLQTGGFCMIASKSEWSGRYVSGREGRVEQKRTVCQILLQPSESSMSNVTHCPFRFLPTFEPSQRAIKRGSWVRPITAPAIGASSRSGDNGKLSASNCCGCRRRCRACERAGCGHH